MGMVLTEANRPHTGEYHYRKVIELTGRRDPITVANLAWNLKNQGAWRRRAGCTRRPRAAMPICTPCSAGRAWRRLTRNLDRALNLLERAGKWRPSNPSILLSRAVVYGRSRDYSRALAVLDSLAAKSGESRPRRQ